MNKDLKSLGFAENERGDAHEPNGSAAAPASGTSRAVFRTQAVAYWSAGYSVVPVMPDTKQPAIRKWTGYCDNLPAEAKRQSWLNDYADHGIGLLLGTEVIPGFRIVAIDIDDERLVEPVCALLDPKCAKIGKKGITIFVKSPIDEKIKSATLKGPGSAAGDLLASGRMTVIPPSLHPDSGQAYRWVGDALLDVGFGSLPVFDKRLQAVLYCVCASEHVDAIGTGEATHLPALQFAAQLVRAGAADEEIEAIIAACLPKGYEGDTLKELSRMIASAREKGFDIDADDDEKATAAIRVMQACFKHGIELFRCEDQAFLSFPTPEGGCLTYPLRNRMAERRIRHIWFTQEGRAIGAMILNEVVATLEAKAFAEAPVFAVWNRVGELAGEIFVDLGRSDGLLVRIGAAGWETCYDRRLKFRRPEGFKELPVPQKPGNLRALQGLLGLSDETFYAVVGFMISFMGPNGPYFGLVIEGEMGSGKSFLASTLKALLDPCDADRLSLPSKDQDLAIHAKQFRLLSYDNTSGMSGVISDALCIVATGGGLATRRLYTDDELSVLKATRPFMLNGISGYAKRPDLLERVIHIHLERVEPENRKEEEALKAEFERLGPAILAGLYDAIAYGQGRDKSTIKSTGLRMADAARRIAASEGACGIPEGAMINAIRESQRSLVIDRISSDSLTIALRTVLANGPFEGTMKQLHDRLKLTNEDRLPGAAASLSVALERQKSALREVGINVVVLARGRQGQRLRIDYVGPEDDAPIKPSLPGY